MRTLFKNASQRDNAAMSTDMPQFVMPPAVATAERSNDGGFPVPTAADVEGGLHASLAMLPAVAARSGAWLARTLVAVGIAGLLLGAVIQGGLHATAGAAAAARSAALEAAAMDYLTAIAEGRASDASALVPPAVRGQVAPDAVLRDARPIRDLAVTVGHVDGDTGAVVAVYTVGGIAVERVLRAEAEGDGWRITTSLAEAPTIHQEHQLAAVTIAGVELTPNRRTLLYPGVYAQDVTDTGIYRSVGSVLVIDGDPASVTEAWSGLELDMMVAIVAADLALDVVHDCQAEASCGVDPAARVQQLDEPQLRSVNPLSGGVDIGAPITIGDRWTEVRIRALPDRLTGAVRWLCPEPERLDLPIVPCER